MPERLARLWVESDQVIRRITTEQQVARGGEDARPVVTGIARINVTPRDLTSLVVDRLKNRLRPDACVAPAIALRFLT